MPVPVSIMNIPAFAASGSASLGGYWSWVTLCGAALITSVIILAFIYAWGTLFRNSELISFVKLELYEVVVTAILVIYVLGIAGSLSTLSIGKLLPPSILPHGVSPDATIYQITENYFLEVGKDMSVWLNLNYFLNVYVDYASSITQYARPLGIGLVSSPLAGFAAPLKQLLYNCTTALTIAYVVNYAQYYTFIFATEVFLDYYLPIGVFLRCFLPTRRLGGTLIAICLSFLLIFPFLTTLTYFIFYNENGPMITFRSFIEQYYGPGGNFWDNISRYFNPFEYSSGLFGFITGALGGIGNLLQDVFGSIFLVIMVFPISVVGKAFMVGYLMPAFNILIFTQAALSLSKSFGEEVDISSLTRMI